MDVSEIGSRLHVRPGIPFCSTMALNLSCMPALQYNDMGRGPRMKAYAAKPLSVVVYFVEEHEEQKRALCAFWTLFL